MIYRLTTGWYPSRNTAEKVLTKVKSVEKNAEVNVTDNVFYTVSCGTFNDLRPAQEKKERLLKRGIYCGIEIFGGVS